MIEVKNICAAYAKHEILTDVSLTIEKGRFTSIVGVNGCGKTTLLKTILGIVPVTAGQIEIDSEPLSEMKENGIARKISYLAQGKNTPDMTVEQLVLHGRFPHLSYPRRYTKKDREIACSAMEKMQLSDYAERPLYTLSGGMRQNAYVAMALAQDTDYILLDEPTTYLDISRQLSLMKTLKSLTNDGKGVVAVMHDLPMAFAVSDRIILLDNSRIVCDDEPRRVYEQKCIEKVFGVEIEVLPDGKNYSYKY